MAIATLLPGLDAHCRGQSYTLLLASSTTFAANPHLFKNMKYSIDDFVGISMVAKSPLVLAAAPNAPFSTLKEMVEYVKLRPGQLSYGTTGRGGNAHVLGEMASTALGIKMVDVPYKGSSAALTDLMGGHIPIFYDGTVSTFPLYHGGKIKILAITTEQRAESAPNIPTFVELGYPDVIASTLVGLFAPAKTPREIVLKLNAAMKTVLENPEVRSILRPDATIPIWTTSEQAAEMFRVNREHLGKVIKTLNLEMQ